MTVEEPSLGTVIVQSTTEVTEDLLNNNVDDINPAINHDQEEDIALPANVAPSPPKSKRCLYTLREKKEILLECEHLSLKEVALKYNLHTKTLRDWKIGGILDLSEGELESGRKTRRKSRHTDPHLNALVDEYCTGYCEDLKMTGSHIFQQNILDEMMERFPHFLESDAENEDEGSARRRTERVRNWVRAFLKRNGIQCDKRVYHWVRDGEEETEIDPVLRNFHQ